MSLAATTAMTMTTCRFVKFKIQCSDSKPRTGFGTKTNNKNKNRNKNNLNQVPFLELMTKIKPFLYSLVKFVIFLMKKSVLKLNIFGAGINH